MELTSIEKTLIEREVGNKSYADIAFLIDRPVDEVREYVKLLRESAPIITHQDVVEEKRRIAAANRKPREYKPREKKKADPVIISRVIVPDRMSQVRNNDANRNRRAYKTRVVDYSTKRLIRVDDKTMIYVDEGEDVQAAIARCKITLKASRKALLEKDE